MSKHSGEHLGFSFFRAPVVVEANMQGSVSGYAKGDPVLAALAAKPNFKLRFLKGGAAGKRQVSHVGAGLATRHSDKLLGFQIAGADKVFHWADAKIDGDAVLLSSEKVPMPVAIRYAWGDKVNWANLFNQDGLPAQTFRTDGW